MIEYIKQIFKYPGGVKFFILTEIILGFGIGMWNLNLNFFLSSKGMAAAAIGKIVAVGPLTTALFAVICGFLCSRFGYKKSMLSGCGIKAAAMLWTAFAVPGIMLYAARGLNGIGDCFILVCKYPYITSIVDKNEKNSIYGLFFSVSMFSMFLGNISAGWLLNSIKLQNPYHTIIVSSAGIAILVMILRWFLPKNNYIKERTKIIYIPRQGFITAYLLFDFLGYTGYFLAYSMLNLIYRDIIGLSVKMTGIVIGLSTVASSAAVFMVTPVATRYGRAKISGRVLSSVTVLYLVMAVSKGPTFIFLAVLTAILQNMLVGLLDGPILNQIPECEKGGYSGLRLFLTNAGTSIGTFASGILLKGNSGYALLYVVVSVLLMVQTLIYFIGFQQKIRDIK